VAENGSLWSWTKRTFLKGLGTLLPTILTIYVFLFVFSFVRYNISEPINVLVGKQIYATEWGKNYLCDRFELPKTNEDGKPLEGEELVFELKSKMPWWPGFIIAFLIVLAVGFFIASFIGRRFWKGGERLLTRMPVVKIVYPYAKQVTEFVFGERQAPVYSRVVAIQYPRQGLWAIGLVTGEGIKGIKEQVHKTMLNVFIPCSPVPMSGFTVIVPESEVVPVNMTVDEAMKFIISAGVIVPEQQLTEEGQTRLVEFKESGRFRPLPEPPGESGEKLS